MCRLFPLGEIRNLPVLVTGFLSSAEARKDSRRFRTSHRNEAKSLEEKGHGKSRGTQKKKMIAEMVEKVSTSREIREG